jgi:hypothetical protein
MWLGLELAVGLKCSSLSSHTMEIGTFMTSPSFFLILHGREQGVRILNSD